MNWDDDWNLVNNPDYRGLTWRQLRRMLTTFLMRHWIPPRLGGAAHCRRAARARGVLVAIDADHATH